MIYLDYSATTPTSEEVLDTFIRVSKDFIGNPNSLHRLGIEAKKLEEASTVQIAELLNVKPEEIIYTSGSTESNNLALKGIALKYENRGKHILTTSLEHSSIYGPCAYLQKLGFEVDFLETDEFGIIDMNSLKEKLREDTILVSVASVNSETGLRQPVEEIGAYLKENSKCFFHVDMTQSIGKINISLENIDLASFSAHKIYGIKGIGALIKKSHVDLEPVIHGGKSTTKYRSGTPALPLIASFAKALRLSLDYLDSKNDYVKTLNNIVKNNLSEYDMVRINSNEYCIPHILNISVMHIKPETLLHALEEKGVYISTQSACSSSNTTSKAVLELTKCEEQARHSVRISLSYKTTDEEIENFLKVFGEVYKKFLDMNE